MRAPQVRIFSISTSRRCVSNRTPHRRSKIATNSFFTPFTLAPGNSKSRTQSKFRILNVLSLSGALLVNRKVTFIPPESKESPNTQFANIRAPRGTHSRPPRILPLIYADISPPQAPTRRSLAAQWGSYCIWGGRSFRRRPGIFSRRPLS